MVMQILMSGGRWAAGIKRLWIVGLLLALMAVVQPGGSEPTINDLIDSAIKQLDLALQQAVLAHVRFPLEDLKFHAQTVLNILEGRDGPHYDPSSADPGDGVGVIRYVDQIRQAPEIQQAGEEIWAALENISLFIEDAIAYTLEALAQTDLEKAQRRMREVLAFLSAAKGREGELTPVGGLLVLRSRVGDQGTPPQGSEE